MRQPPGQRLRTPGLTVPSQMDSDSGAITQLLSRWSEGDDDAFPALMALAYDDLRAIAHRRLRAGDGDGLGTTALVHETYLRLVRHDGGAWEGRAHFYAFAARAMRHILVDHARRAAAERRGGGAVRIPFDEVASMASQGLDRTPDGARDVLGVNDAIHELAARHPRMAQVVELRFFGGLSVPEVAEVLGASVRTVEREWTRAKAYLIECI